MAEASLERRAIRRSFDRAARRYDENAILQREIGARLVEHLAPMRLAPSRVIDLGCGTGGSFDALSQRFPGAELIGIDLAPNMLHQAAGRASWWKRTFSRLPRLVCADAERLPLAAASAQLVFSNLALQWCDPGRVFTESARVLAPEGLFLFSTFGPDTLKELRSAFAQADDAPHVHRFIDMHDLGDALVHAGFADPVMEMEVVTLEYSKVEDAARDLKAIGAHSALVDRPRGLSGRARWRRMAESYERFRRDTGLPATYEVIYGHAWKVPPKRTSDGRQVIDFRPRDPK
ncbi:malonyl-ACP O-methyltransferase BioC [Usitatibacter palustris]|uniref:Malonyl-[acyl-carrier protein] O-methyltransferase n=1 Tax=Usitatibacter palustris TaxID=2732487 RepID=A0A6M4H3F1_9PROT|nr:malonyl-ACP O-methyltransferase BioC [Usitatibacter palustris]QJR13875.1 Malonyl-[acyl-carrier protein] O-methyltransferase [Usitatibacter palustris]